MRALETERLWLRPLELADATQVQPLFASWEIVRYLTVGVAWPFPADGAMSYYRDVALPAMARGDEWHWTLRLKADPTTVIGSIALLRNEKNNRGFWIGLPWQGRGLMTEAVEAATDFWFEDLQQPLLRVPKAAANRASSRISEKTGMQMVSQHDADYVSGRLATEVWEMTQEEWRKRKAQAARR